METINNISLSVYKKAIENLASNKSALTFNNSSPEHAAVVLSTMIKHSDEYFRIYDDNLSGDIADLNEEFYINLDFFVKAQKKLKIVIDCKKCDYKESRIFSLLLQYKKNFPDNVFIATASDEFKESVRKTFNKNVNFAVGDSKSFRVEDIFESSKGLRRAVCCFNNTSIAEKLVTAFDSKFLSCQSI